MHANPENLLQNAFVDGSSLWKRTTRVREDGYNHK
jgi:hypothetical protein